MPLLGRDDVLPLWASLLSGLIPRLLVVLVGIQLGQAHRRQALGELFERRKAHGVVRAGAAKDDRLGVQLGQAQQAQAAAEARRRYPTRITARSVDRLDGR